MNEINIGSPLTLERVTALIRQSLALDDVQESTELIASELLDSVSVVNLVLELEQALAVKIPESEVTPENFETPATIASLCERLGQH